MNKSPSHQLLLIGLPGTGKTSYLAALWYMVNQSNVDCRLKLAKLDGNSKYLNNIRDAWLEYRPVPRNSLDSETVVSMALEDRETGLPLGLSFPDLSGESFRLQWTKRELTSGYDEQLRKASGGILFVHPNGIVKPHRIDTLNALVDALGVAGPEEDVRGDNVLLKQWDIEKAPTQVQLVELLQFISNREYFRAPFRLAILVSAWDVVTALHQTPVDWVSRQLPLLRQFLECNEGMFDVAFYGVSAQGGRYASSLFSESDFKDTFLVRLREKRDPVSSWLCEQLDEAAQSALRENAANQASGTLPSLVVQNVNKVIAKASIYDQGRFTNVELRSETKALINITGLAASVQQREETIRMNRLLLEDTYPSEVLRTRQNDIEVSALHQKLPARRVSLVGADIKNPHDITEPLQWLMR
jgi:hypothetical protein